MKVSLNWLKDYVAVGVPAKTLAHRLTMAGLEVEKEFSVGGDTVFELEITPNRADCLNMLGIAREVSAILNKTKDFPKSKVKKFPKKKCDIKVVDKKGCPKYLGTVIENVDIKETPQWIQKRIFSLGMRSNCNVVDITNFCLMENGQPLHAFDYDKLAGNKIIVRRAKEGEKIVTIDSVERELDPSILVIADAQRPVAIAGVMGGKNTEVTRETKNVLLESAYFDPILIRRASRKLGISTDSSYRFERGVDYDNVDHGAKRALSLILASTKGTLTKHTNVSAAKAAVKRPKVVISKNQVNELLGSSLTIAQCRNILKKLDFEVAVQKKDVLKVSAPLFREDINREVDVVEEIARVIGYDNLPMTLPNIKASTMATSQVRNTRQEIKNIVSAAGFSEVITYTMINQKALEKTNQGNLKSIKIQNPLTQDQEILQPTLLPGFLSITAGNLNRGQKDLKFFETGKVYTSNGEKEVVALLATGSNILDWRSNLQNKVNFYDLKGVLDKTFRTLQVPSILFQAGEVSFLEQGESAEIILGKKTIGVVGKVVEEVLSNFNIKERNVYFSQIYLDAIYQNKKTKRKFQPIPEYPSIIRDVSIAVDRKVSFQEIKNIAIQLGGGLLSSIRFIEEYLGEKISSDQRGLVFSLVYQSNERTLREDDVNIVHEKILKEIVNKLGAVIR